MDQGLKDLFVISGSVPTLSDFSREFESESHCSILSDSLQTYGLAQAPGLSGIL